MSFKALGPGPLLLLPYRYSNTHTRTFTYIYTSTSLFATRSNPPVTHLCAVHVYDQRCFKGCFPPSASPSPANVPFFLILISPRRNKNIVTRIVNIPMSCVYVYICTCAYIASPCEIVSTDFHCTRCKNTRKIQKEFTRRSQITGLYSVRANEKKNFKNDRPFNCTHVSSLSPAKVSFFFSFFFTSLYNLTTSTFNCD